ncbi:hypothetical protein ACLOJK_008185 [Asimina triloba]
MLDFSRLISIARPIRKWRRENERGCEEVVVLVLKEEKGKIEGLRAQVQLQNLLSLLVGVSSLLVPSIVGAPTSEQRWEGLPKLVCWIKGVLGNPPISVSFHDIDQFLRNSKASAEGVEVVARQEAIPSFAY